jgi:hypothetical protein
LVGAVLHHNRVRIRVAIIVNIIRSSYM